MNDRIDCDIRCKRVYVPAAADDGRRVLIDRLWPRGMRREALALDEWLSAVAPSTALRRIFHRDPQRFSDFAEAYRAELAAHPEHWQALLVAAGKGRLTLLYAARDEQQNHARVLAAFLEAAWERRGSPSSPVCYGEF